jgi:hypothetical protein
MAFSSMFFFLALFAVFAMAMNSDLKQPQGIAQMNGVPIFPNCHLFDLGAFGLGASFFAAWMDGKASRNGGGDTVFPLFLFVLFFFFRLFFRPSYHHLSPTLEAEGFISGKYALPCRTVSFHPIDGPVS